jgi:hypothetical protein
LMYVACLPNWFKHVVFRSLFEQILEVAAQNNRIRRQAFVPCVAQLRRECLVQLKI